MLRPDTIHRYTISSGFDLLVDIMPESQGLSLGLWFPFGSAWESLGEYGLCHFIEHMFFKGAAEMNALDLSRAVDRVGGYINAFTDHETVCVHCLVPSENILMAIEILFNMVYRPRFDKTEFEREKTIIINEIRADSDDPEESALDEFWAGVYQGHSAARRISGSVNDVMAIEYDDLINFYNEFFKKCPITISVAGEIEPQKIADYVHGLVSKLGLISHPIRSIENPTFFTNRRIVNTQSKQVYFIAGALLDYKVSVHEFWALRAINSAYGDGMASRLFMNIREAKGLCYSIYSSFTATILGCYWGVVASTGRQQLPAFIEAYVHEASVLANKGLTETEATEAISRLRGHILLSSAAPEYRMKRMARQNLLTGNVTSVYDDINMLQSYCNLDCEHINFVVKKYLNIPASILLYGNVSQKAEKKCSEVLNAVRSESLLGKV